MEAQTSNPAGAIARARGVVVTRALFLCLLAALTTTGGCNTTTLFQSNFDTTGFDQPPSPTQAVGTAEVSAEPNTVIVAQAPPNATPPAKWLRITRTKASSPASSFQGKLVRQQGNGTYTFSTALFIPLGETGPTTVQFEQFSQPVEDPVGFLRLDFMPNGRVRLDNDENTFFGTFPFNQVFLVQVTLNINDTSPSAHIVLSGAGATGNTERDIIPALRTQALQFGAIRFLTGSPTIGTFYATNVVVTH
ncbi:MAG: hypothetical protein LC746_06350 [Acidobacteria bacterium]|nr:hypothetical protein [Acidobacteriota bacterium]